MDARQALQLGIEMAEYVSMAYVNDLSDEELMRRPAPSMNHIKWQLGHLIVSERRFSEIVRPGSCPALPAGFEDRYTKETAGSDDPAAFDSKETLLNVHREQRKATLAVLNAVPESEWDRETGLDYAPTVASLLSLQGSHWLMHAGQWAVVRRQLGRPPLF